MEKMQRRHFKAAAGATTIALDVAFWEAIDHIADKHGMTWRQWVSKELPANIPNRASHLRLAVLREIHHCRCRQ